MQPKFGLVNNDKIGQFIFRLHEQSDEADRTKSAIRKLVWPKHLIRSFVLPVQNSVGSIVGRVEYEIVEKRSNETDGRENTLVGCSVLCSKT